MSITRAEPGNYTLNGTLSADHAIIITNYCEWSLLSTSTIHYSHLYCLSVLAMGAGLVVAGVWLPAMLV